MIVFFFVLDIQAHKHSHEQIKVSKTDVRVVHGYDYVVNVSANRKAGNVC